ncbi:hypothetical protein [Azospirillum sp.]|uniref:hypothetical protein n=1 Tax=Azospirillum sp. TaxID=34012 RepID=UPI00261E3788|nr:hypothetical protein [Azospirillum sp.]
MDDQVVNSWTNGHASPSIPPSLLATDAGSVNGLSRNTARIREKRKISVDSSYMGYVT